MQQYFPIEYVPYLRGQAVVTANFLQMQIPYTGLLESVRLYCTIAGAGGNTEFDFLKNGTSLFGGTKPYLAAAATDSGDFTPDTHTFTPGDLFTISCTAIPTTPPSTFRLILKFKYFDLPFYVMTGTAGAAISAYDVLYTDGTEIFPADSTDATQLYKVVGIAMEDTDDGDTVKIQYAGIVTNGSWTWTLGQPIFFDNAGVLTQTEPVSGFWQPVGFPVAATQIYLQLGVPNAL